MPRVEPKEFHATLNKLFRTPWCAMPTLRSLLRTPRVFRATAAAVITKQMQLTKVLPIVEIGLPDCWKNPQMSSNFKAWDDPSPIQKSSNKLLSIHTSFVPLLV